MDTSAFKARLEEEKAEVERQLSEVSVRNPQDPKDWQPNEDVSVPEADDNIVADRAEEFEQHQALTEDLERRLAEIDKALSKIEEGTYGICEVGGEQIEPERLEANPAATTCTKHMQ